MKRNRGGHHRIANERIDHHERSYGGRNSSSPLNEEDVVCKNSKI
jgi:hypothetical protein